MVVEFDFRVVDHNEFVVFDVINLRISGQHSFLASFALELEHIVHRTINVASQSTSLDVMFRLLIKSLELIDSFVESRQLVSSHQQSDFLTHVEPKSKHLLGDSAEYLQLEHLLSALQDWSYHQTNNLIFI